jgi:hypothetical protein
VVANRAFGIEQIIQTVFWAALLGGGLMMFEGHGWVRAVGTVAFTVPFLALLFFAYAWLAVRLIYFGGGDASEGFWGIVIFASFAIVAVPVLFVLFYRLTGRVL